MATRNAGGGMGFRVHVQTVGRGQELVCDVDGIPEAAAWLRGLFA